MTDSKHTPGPWSIDPEGEIAISIEGPAGTVVCDVHGTPARREANAYLIAAAPDMLEALRACVSAMAKVIDQTDAGHMLDDQWESARSAIAKVSGGEE